jgi:hypothetical protein
MNQVLSARPFDLSKPAALALHASVRERYISQYVAQSRPTFIGGGVRFPTGRAPWREELALFLGDSLLGWYLGLLVY